MSSSNYKGRSHIRTFHDAGVEQAWHSYKCGHCNKEPSGAVVAAYPEANGPLKWLLCTACGDASVLTRNGTVYPPASTAPIIRGLPSDVNSGYKEAKDCLSFNAFTACELICRKILMHVAVEKGAKEGDTFKNYIAFLESSGYVTPPMKTWVGIIKDSGNDSTHKIAVPSKDHAEGVLSFTALLLQLIYETEYLSNNYSKKA